MQDSTYARDGRSVTELIAALAEEGWSTQATPLEGGLVRCERCGVTSTADEIAVDSLSRVEGASDPGDEAVVVGVSCPRCAARAVMVLAYGPNASAADADVLVGLPDPPSSDDSVLD